MSTRHLFGPISSRRLGRSLGVDLLPVKTCPFDCVYCEVGRTTHRTARRAMFVPAAEVIAELRDFFASGGQADYITFSGSGEPTLYAGLGRLIRESKRLFGVPVAVITNGALMSDPRVRAELMDADIVMPSLDSARQASFAAVNRPSPGITADKVIDGLVTFAREYKGRLWLEVLLVEGVNDSSEDVDALVAAIGRIAPERVQLNTVVRPPAEEWARPVERKRLEEIAARLSEAAPTEIIAPAPASAYSESRKPDDSAVIETLRRRPCTVDDLAGGLSVSPALLTPVLESLVEEGKIRKMRFGGGDFYEALKSPAG